MNHDSLVIRFHPPLAESADEGALKTSDGDDGENEDVFYSSVSDEQALRDQSAPLIPAAEAASAAPTHHR